MVVMQILALAVGLPLQILVIAALVRGPWRRYPFVFIWALADFLTTVLEIRPSLVSNPTSAELQSFNNLYWWDERVIQVLTFFMVISLVYLATAKMRPRRLVLFGTLLGTAVFAGITFFIEYSPDIATGRWMRPWTRDLNFCAAILDLGLWAVLIGTPKRDYRLLMVSGALGIQFTGIAIGQALSTMSTGLQSVLAWIIPWVYISCSYIMWQAFRTEPGRATAPSVKVKQPAK